MKKELSMKNRIIWENGIYGALCCILAPLYMLDGILSVVVGGVSIVLLLMFHLLDRHIKKEQHDEMSWANFNKSARDAQYYSWIIFLIIGTVDVCNVIPPLHICTTVIIMMGVSRIIQCILFVKYEREGI